MSKEIVFQAGMIVQQGITGSGRSRNTFAIGIVLSMTPRKVKVIKGEFGGTDIRLFKQPSYFDKRLCTVIGQVQDVEKWNKIQEKLQRESHYALMVSHQELQIIRRERHNQK